MNAIFNQGYYSIPFELAVLVYQNGCILEFRVWLLLKDRCNGHLIITKDLVNEIAQTLGYSVKSIQRALIKLRKWNWLGYNTTKGHTYVRGLDRIRTMYGFSSKLAVTFDSDAIINTRAFLASCIDAYFIRGQKIKAWRDKEEGARTIKRAIQPNSKSPGYLVSLSLAEKFFMISKSKACRGRKLASSAGFTIVTKSKAIPLGDINIKIYLRAFPEDSDYVFQKGGRWWKRQADFVKTSIKFKRRRSPIIFI